MRALRHALRFMRVVPPLPALLVRAFVLVTLAGAGALGAGAVRPADALTPLLVLQTFAVSTGFATYARRGHYDLLLTSGATRLTAAVAQWLTAVAPGVLGWAALVAVDAGVRDGPPVTLAPGTVVALLLVSTVPWAVTVGLPRFAGSLGWLLACVTAASLGPSPAGVAPAGGRRDLTPASMAHGLLFPSQLVGVTAAPWSPVLLPALVVAAIAMLAALGWIHRRDVPLETGQ